MQPDGDTVRNAFGARDSECVEAISMSDLDMHSKHQDGCSQLPGNCNCERVSWIWAIQGGFEAVSEYGSEEGSEEETSYSGKWMLFPETGSKVIETWRVVKRLLAMGLLGDTAKVSPRTLGKSRAHLICVYTSDYRDIADCFRVLLALRDSVPGCKHDLLNYKTDEATYAGHYRTSEGAQSAGFRSATKKPHRNFSVSRYTSPKIVSPSTSVVMYQNNLGPNYERRLVAEQ
eukprot:gene24193-9791_t